MPEFHGRGAVFKVGEPLRMPAGVPQPPYLRRESGAEFVWHCDYPLKEI